MEGLGQSKVVEDKEIVPSVESGAVRTPCVIKRKSAFLFKKICFSFKLYCYFGILSFDGTCCDLML